MNKKIADRIEAGGIVWGIERTLGLLILVSLLPQAVAANETVRIQPGAEIQNIVAGKPAGTTYQLAPGLYRLTKTIAPKTGDQIIGSPGTVLNGAKLLTAWTPQGKFWVATGQTQRSEISWKKEWPEIADPAAQYNEDVFLDDRPLKRVLSLAEVGSGSFFFDYAHASIYIGDDPAGHRVECGATQIAIESHAGNVVVRGLVIEKYTLAGVQAGRAWLVQSNEARYVHGAGIRFSAQAQVLHNYAHHNGKYGITGSGEDALVEGNELAFNNAALYRTKRGGGYYDAGGTKFVHSRRLIVRGNYSHDNYGDGFWSDIDNINTTYENNRIEHNYEHGIFLEIGYAATIRNNQIRGNMSAGIYINSTSDQDIYGNRIENNGVGTPDNGLRVLDVARGGILIMQQERGKGQYGERLSKNNRVHDNIIQLAAGLTGLTRKQGTPKVFSQNNLFFHNRYLVPAPDGAWWSGEAGALTWAQWRATGQDKDSTIERAAAK